MTDNSTGQDIREQVEERLKAEKEAQAPPQADDDGLPVRFVNDCLTANERGDGALFAALHRGRFVFNVSLDKWYFWKGHYWDMDMAEAMSMRAVEGVALRYLTAAEELDKKIEEADVKGKTKTIAALKAKQEAYNKRAKRLR